MMNWILVVGTCVILILEFISNDRDISNPAVLYVSSFFLSSVFLALNTNIWNYTISNRTVFVIILALLMFCFGSRIGKRIKIKKTSNAFDEKDNSPISETIQLRIPSLYLVIIVLLEIVAIILRLLNLYAAVGSMAIFSDDVIRSFRASSVSTIYTTPLKILSPVMNAIGLTFVVFLIDSKVKKVKHSKKYLIPIIGYFLYFTLSSARIEILYLFTAIIVVYLFVQKNLLLKDLNIKQIRMIVFLASGMLIAFYLLGFITGKSQKQASFFDNISMYIGSSIALFDHILAGFKYDSTNVGTYTLSGISNLLSRFGINLESVGTGTNEFYRLGSMVHSSNVATCLKALVYDYNIVGMCLINLCEGALLSVFYKIVKKRIVYGNLDYLIIYAYFCELMLFSAISERIITSTLTVSMLVFVISVKIITKFVRAYSKEE